MVTFANTNSNHIIGVSMDSKILIERITNKLGIKKEKGEAIYGELVAQLGEHARNLDSIAVPGFGAFESKKRLERINVHPATGKRMLLPPKVVIGFKPSQILKQKINNSQQ